VVGEVGTDMRSCGVDALSSVAERLVVERENEPGPDIRGRRRVIRRGREMRRVK
jgi:hypothetical protein